MISHRVTPTLTNRVLDSGRYELTLTIVIAQIVPLIGILGVDRQRLLGHLWVVWIVPFTLGLAV